METKDLLLELRTNHRLSQEELAEKLFVTRQAVSKWERGVSIPNQDTLLRLSQLFGVSVDALLGASKPTFCQSCGMPLSPETFAQEDASSLNPHYCKWCYEDGHFTYDCTMEEMVESCIPHMGWPDPEACRQHLLAILPHLDRWNTKK
jgi:transcriptional regulator with XRE-family HTH domain